MNRAFAAALAVLAAAALPAAAQAPLAPIPDSLERFGLRFLKKALDDTGLSATLRGKGPYTLFAPSNSAFVMLGKDRYKALLADRKALTAVLKNHVVLGKLEAADLAKLKDKSKLKTLGGTVVVRTRGTLLVDNSKPVMPDQKVSNGVVHVMDRVLMPKK